jgi:hypothetical protein
MLISTRLADQLGTHVSTYVLKQLFSLHSRQHVRSKHLTGPQLSQRDAAAMPLDANTPARGGRTVASLGRPPTSRSAATPPQQQDLSVLGTRQQLVARLLKAYQRERARGAIA